jgi:hypothetical protein
LTVLAAAEYSRLSLAGPRLHAHTATATRAIDKSLRFLQIDMQSPRCRRRQTSGPLIFAAQVMEKIDQVRAVQRATAPGRV